jgi:small subunit ribosomal protein S1
MSDISFEQLLEESFNGSEMKNGAMVMATVVGIDSEVVMVDAGMKSEAAIPVAQFKNEAGELEVAVGDTVEVCVESLEDGFGETRLSREKAKRAQTWIELEKFLESGEIITGHVAGKVKGGLTVDIKNVRAFLPGSLVDVRPVRDLSYLEDKDIEIKVIKLDKRRNNVVVSRRAVIEQESSHERDAILANLNEGSVVKGLVKNLTDYGAFIDLGGVDGLLHITDMAWKRVSHPSELLQVGQEVDVKVLKYDQERNRVSLGMKQLEEDPWGAIENRFPVGANFAGKVANITDYGAFVELEEGVEGLVHTSELDWTNRNIHPSKVVHLGQEVSVRILEIDKDRRRISLSLKQTLSNPWNDFAANYNKGDRISGGIKSITDFGIFIGLEGGIDGLVHLTDISWSETGEEAVRNFKKGEEVETVILAIDAEKERISLGIKQLEQDPFSQFIAENSKGGIVKGTVKEVDDKGAVVILGEEIEGYLRKQEMLNDVSVGDKVEALIVNVDRKNRNIALSTKQKEAAEEKQALKDYNKSSTNDGGNTLGALFDAQKQS